MIEKLLKDIDSDNYMHQIKNQELIDFQRQNKDFIDSLNYTIKNLQEQIDNANKNIRELEKEISELRSELGKYDRDLASQSKICAALMVYYNQA